MTNNFFKALAVIAIAGNIILYLAMLNMKESFEERIRPLEAEQEKIINKCLETIEMLVGE